ncbi:34571_t:CDS:2 [Gigaspora margarita]|uniref:34571_t:CDS:1 n=1 Tax=Gigaspora margarita TaxID=4874 RepID=A0ABN7VS46_GIGMA|nr:34571_t:CDS:2 [Gigaspora margarita]
MACWMIVGIPQLYENYKRKSGDSVSLTFVYIWLLGDLFNLLGAILQNLILPVVLIAIYHNGIDSSIILQIYYYRFRRNSSYLDEEITPLQPVRIETQTSVYRPRVNQFWKILIGFVGVCLAGVIMYYISTLFRNNEASKDDQQKLELLPQIFGWCSAMLYLGARIPQIIKNHKSQSTDGLSLAMFCFCVLGNVTFCSSILLYSTEFNYILINLPWLLGNGGTLMFDFVRFNYHDIYLIETDDSSKTLT